MKKKILFIFAIMVGLFIYSGTNRDFNFMGVNSKAVTYTVTFDANSGTGTMTDQIFPFEVEQNITLNSFLKTRETFLEWNTSADGTGTSYANGGSYIATENIILYAQWQTPNEPVLGPGMEPVKFTEDGTDIIITSDDTDWYSYEFASATPIDGSGTVGGDGTGKWANAKTTDGSYWVWIPRYSYKITSGEHSDGNSWSSDNAGTNKIEIRWSDGVTDDETDGYIAHPAFTFGADELTGIWVAKYEASSSDATSLWIGNSTTPAFKPNKRSFTYKSISDMFDYAKEYNETLNSHMMKNSEWGAVAYLTNAIGRIPYKNNKQDPVYVPLWLRYGHTGYAGAEQEVGLITFLYNTPRGVKGSTTHNIYGLYDMSGGVFEYGAAYLDNDSDALSDNGSSLVASVAADGNKYVDVYKIGTTDTQIDNYTAWGTTEIVKGDAIYETSYRSGSWWYGWDDDFTSIPSQEKPFFGLGGNCVGTGGLFEHIDNSGAKNPSEYSLMTGFRACLALPTYTVNFDANGGTGSMAPQTFIGGIAENLNAMSFTREGYTFAGWATTEDGSIVYANEASLTTSINMTLYAKWIIYGIEYI